MRRDTVIEIKIDWEDLAEAFEESQYSKDYYIDLQTGDIFCIQNADNEQRESVMLDRNRFLQLIPPNSRIQYK